MNGRDQDGIKIKVIPAGRVMLSWISFNQWKNDSLKILSGYDAIVEMDGVVEAAAVMDYVVAFCKLIL